MLFNTTIIINHFQVNMFILILSIVIFIIIQFTFNYTFEYSNVKFFKEIFAKYNYFYLKIGRCSLLWKNINDHIK